MIVLCRHLAPDDDGSELAMRVAAYGPRVVYTSPLERALRTAEAVARGCGVDMVVDPRLREIDCGDVEGLGFDELPLDLRRGLLEEPTRVRFPGGETYEELRARVVEALDELAGQSGTVAVVSHAGAIRAALATWLAMDESALWRIDQRLGSLNVVEFVEGVPLVRLVNG